MDEQPVQSDQAGKGPASGQTPRRVLILASDFAPLPSVGRLRVQKFCKYLPRHGWEVHVVTFQPTYGADPKLLAELPPGLQVERTTVPRIIDGMIGLAKRLLSRSAKTKETAQTATPSSAPAPAPAPAKPGGVLASISLAVDRIKKWAGRHLLVPDDNMLGIWGMTAAAVRIIRQWKPSVILVSVPGFSPQLAAALAHRITGIPMVVDYRDLWHGDVLREWIGPIRSRLELMLERWCLRQASAITAVSNNYLAEAQTVTGGGRAARPGLWITNGFDPDDFPPRVEVAPSAAPTKIEPSCCEAAPPTAASSRPMEILHAGRLFKNRTADGLLTALGEMRSLGRLADGEIHVTFLGDVESAQMLRLEALMKQFHLNKIVTFRSYVTRNECLRMQTDANCLLIIGNEGRKSAGTMSMKLFEYAGTGRPVLALVNEGEGLEFVRRSGMGRTAPISDVPQIRQALEDLLADWRSGNPLARPDAEFLRTYQFPDITRRLADFLDEVLQRP